MKTRVLLSIAVLLIAAFVGVSYTSGQTSLPYVFTPPGVEFTMKSTTCTDGACTKIEWERKQSGGAWLKYMDTESLTMPHEIKDTLARGRAARYRCKAYSVGWKCDVDSCGEIGDRVYGATSPPSDWVIGWIPGPGPGGCGKPVK